MYFDHILSPHLLNVPYLPIHSNLCYFSQKKTSTKPKKKKNEKKMPKKSQNKTKAHTQKKNQRPFCVGQLLLNMLTGVHNAGRYQANRQQREVIINIT